MTSEMPRRAPATSPAFLNSAIFTSFSAPEIGFFTLTVCASSGRFFDAQALVEERILR